VELPIDGGELPIIDIDFLRSHGLLVDVANLRLLPGELPVAAVNLAASQAAPAVCPRSYAEAVRGTSSPSPQAVSFSGVSPTNASSLVGPTPSLPTTSSEACAASPPLSD
jgi:hypothetical protein